VPPDTPKEMLNPSTLVAPIAEVGPRTRAVLTIVGGTETGRILSLSGGLRFTLGRRASSTHRIDDASISGTHASVIATGTEYVVNDEGSTNGTYVNGQRITEPTPLRDGDRVQLGPIVLLFSRVHSVEEEALKRTYDAVMRDSLTGAFNRKHLMERLESELAFAKRHRAPLSLIVFDVDHFKQLNDTHGHLAGDAVLKSIVATLTRSVRTEDVVARYGGEEFVVTARQIPIDVATQVANRLRAAVAEAAVPFAGRDLHVTMSGGVASLACVGESADALGLLALADRRLYSAKRAGRNVIVGTGK